METKTKLITGLSLALIVSTIGNYLSYKSLTTSKEKYTELLGTTTELKKLQDKMVQLKTEYLREAELKKEVQRKFDKLSIAYNEYVKSVSETVTDFKGRETSDSRISIEEESSPEICYTKEGKLGLFPFKITQEQALLKDSETGEERLISQAYYTLDPSVDSRWAGVDYKLSEIRGVVKTNPVVENKEYNGIIYLPLNLNLGANTSQRLTGTVTLLGVGRSNRDLDIKLLSPGLGYGVDKRTVGVLNLVSSVIKTRFTSNTYIGLDYQTDKKFAISLSAGL